MTISLFLKNSGKVLIISVVVPKMIIVDKFKTKDSPDAKQNNEFSDEMRFNTHTPGKNVRGRNFYNILFK